MILLKESTEHAEKTVYFNSVTQVPQFSCLKYNDLYVDMMSAARHELLILRDGRAVSDNIKQERNET
jgi:hypothetical protein